MSTVEFNADPLLAPLSKAPQERELIRLCKLQQQRTMLIDYGMSGAAILTLLCLLLRPFYRRRWLTAVGLSALGATTVFGKLSVRRNIQRNQARMVLAEHKAHRRAARREAAAS